MHGPFPAKPASMPTLEVRLWEQSAGLKTGGEELLDAKGIRWVDVLDQDESVMNRLGKRFGLHRLAIEDCLHLDQRPKLEDFPGHPFLVVQGFRGAQDI